MTHQNHQTNGASLEDCHTNFFALTDLCGIKWRKLAQGERPNASSYPLEDPVLRSYSKCLEVDILCVWRRVAAPKPAEQDPNVFEMSIPGPVTGGSVIHPPLSLTAAKELWIFWYGEEPDLTDLVDSELLRSSEGDKGSWEGGLSYECRSLLFKALHNVIERCLLSRDVVRLGRWFVQPSSNSERVFGKSSLHLSFSFAFFVHGDSTVCASMDIREHPPVRPLMIKHLEEAQAQQGNNSSSSSSSDAKQRSVILAPFGLAATLTGQSYKASDPQTQKVLDDWSAFYPISNKNINLSESADTVPPIVEIMTGGIKMRYPSKYVLVTDIDDWSPPATSSAGGSAQSTPNSAKPTSQQAASSLTVAVTNSLAATNALGDLNSMLTAGTCTTSGSNRNNPDHRDSKPLMNPPLTVPESPSNDLGNQNSMSSAAINNSASVLIPERVWQDCIMHAAAPAVAAPSQQSPVSGESGGGGVSIKSEPKDPSSNASSNASSLSTNSGGCGGNNNENNAGSNTALVDANANSVWEITDPAVKMPCCCIKLNQNCGAAGGSTPYGGPPSYCRNPLSIGDSHPLPSEGSPASAAPSPMQPSSVSQPTSVPSGDQLITMSPHPPASNNPRSVQPGTPCLDHLDKNTPAPTPTDQHDSKSITASPYHTPSHTGGVMSVEAPSSQQPQQQQTTPQQQQQQQLTQQQQMQHQQQPSQQQQQQQQLVGANLSSTSSDSSGGTTNSSPGNNNLPPSHGMMMGIKIKSEGGLGITAEGGSMLGSGPCIYSSLNPVAVQNQISKKEAMLQILQSLKRPSLSSRDYESMMTEDSPCTSHLLYDYSAIDAWMNHPVKKHKPNEDSKLAQQIRQLDLYSDQKHSTDKYLPSVQNVAPDGTATRSMGPGVGGIKQDPQDPLALPEDVNSGSGESRLLSESQIKTEVGCEAREGDGQMLGAHEIKKEKEDKDDSLFTEQGLQPALDDLDQLFDDSNNYHDDTDMHANTSPASTKSGGVCMETIKMFPGSGNIVNSGILSPKELSQMFPTPPSLEHHPNSSPGGGGCLSDGMVIDTMVETTAIPILGSPQEEPIDDWSYVFLPPPICKYVGSSKYAPLQQLPSQLIQPQITLPLNCVYKSSSQLRKEKQEREKLIKMREAQDQQEAAQQQQQQQQQTQSENIAPNVGAVSTKIIKQETPLTVPQPLSTPNSLNLNGPGHPYSNSPSQGGQSQPLSRPPSVNSLPGGMMGSGGNMMSPSPMNNGLMNNSMFHPGMGINVPLRQGMSPISPATPGGGSATGGNPMRVPTPQTSCPLPYPSPIGAINNIGSPNPLNQMNFRRTPILPPPPYDVAIASPATSTTSSYHNKQYGIEDGPQTPSAGGPGGGPTQRIPIETNALLVNVLLYDTSLNIFRDHNFNSCTLCVCNAGPKCVGNIRGADSGLYLALPGTSFLSSGKSCAASGSSSEREAKSTPSSVSQFNGNNHNNNGAFGMMDSPAAATNSGASGGANLGVVSINTNNLQNGYLDEDPVKCTCGFSALVNRRLAHRAGLFYEDELEITGMAEDPALHKKNSLLGFLLGKGDYSSGINCDNSPLPLRIMDLLREHCAVIQSSSNSIHRAVARFRSAMTAKSLTNVTVHMLEYSDANDVISLALEQSRLQAVTENRLEYLPLVKSGLLRGVMNVHKWPYLRAGGPRSNQDIIRIMKSMQPLLQDAFHKKCTTRLWDAPYTIQGPLTWRQFHRLAGRGTGGQCEPQPVPSLVVGYEKDWLSLSPYSIQYWDKLLLEPYSYPRDIAYVVVLPDNDYVVSKVKTYFKELSTTYEMCKLGRHNPIKGWDGILRVGSNRVLKETQNSSIDEWFTSLGDTRLSELLRLYAQTCQQQLAPYLSKVPSDKSLLDPPENHNVSASSHAAALALAQASSTPNREAPGQSPMPPPPPSTPDPNQPGDKAPSTPKSENDTENRDSLNTSATSTADRMQHDDDGKEPPHIVLYMVEPFTCGTDSPEIERLACLSLLRCYSNILSTVPDSIRSNISVQLISLENILELGRSRNRLRLSDHMRCQALNIFSQSRRYMQHMNNVKSLTGFGTAANAEQFMKNKDEKNRAPYKLYTPPYVLAKLCEKKENSESFGQTSIKQQCSIMYCSYCLSEDQSWLLAVATDDRGEFLETVTINIDIPNRIRRKRASARRLGLQKLMDFILGLISQTVHPWRIVIGRIGRIGHGELKGWSWLLSKQNLQKASKHLKDLCEQCSLMHPVSVPSILSACLVTLEPDSELRVMPDQFTPDERFSQLSMQSPLTTPQDVTCTHILVFPTSARTQSAQSQFVAEHINDELELTLGDGNLDDLGLGEDCDEDGINGLGDLFDNWDDLPMPQQMQQDSRQGSPIQFEGQRQSPGDSGSNCAQNLNGYTTQEAEDVGSLAQQPMAIGYLVSTAPTGRMPAWFWSSCPHLENVCPVFLRIALHLNSFQILQNNDDPMTQSQSTTEHPLDSNMTADVLRFVLEGYNVLSWLAMDSNTHDRLSCLPIHVQVLMQLYHMTAALA
ncbi:mediator of RNA polymerase II transcription subunit 13 isoform X2 [Toxorhynchites rutilus septentrionalis]|uniref:mediator of RNA polymerase II transcription subunit 13 isoform X2 n=1 Tax=Toxorhynchites rutilus septentrionalis TaxID=329112 RepID=UPI00247915CC|nr:mediator of RNA polymerase II transcription subunit 13 isoform X2 [Toxorhynchites rutilus septentrionalis]